ncbi:hypothetical protein AAF712_013755 [Marasmius tenuissimus]|uniref:Uncharacterized protein n=1 Tax=Marasmius tenuissimus TaxID=585030 RepID=A0ABR2ZCU1_9AGAR
MVISDDSWLSDFKTVRWEGVGGQVALLWLEHSDLQRLTNRHGLLEVVEEFRSAHRQIDRSQQTWLLLYGENIEDKRANLEIIQAQFALRIHVITAADEESAIFKLVTICEVVAETTVHFGHYPITSRTIFRQSLEEEVGVEQAVAELVALRFKNWETLTETIDGYDLTLGSGPHQLFKALLKEQECTKPHVYPMTEKVLKESAQRLYEYVLRPPVFSQ